MAVGKEETEKRGKEEVEKRRLFACISFPWIKIVETDGKELKLLPFSAIIHHVNAKVK